jgi:hypothetical protein
MNVLLGFVVLSWLSLMAPAVVPEPQHIAGDYTCSGESDGHPYTLTLGITTLGQDTYRLEWQAKDPSSTQMATVYVGLGMKSADVLAVLFMSREGQVAVSLYRIKGSTLSGEWTSGDGERYPEECHREESL